MTLLEQKLEQLTQYIETLKALAAGTTFKTPLKINDTIFQTKHSDHSLAAYLEEIERNRDHLRQRCRDLNGDDEGTLFLIQRLSEQIITLHNVISTHLSAVAQRKTASISTRFNDPHQVPREITPKTSMSEAPTLYETHAQYLDFLMQLKQKKYQLDLEPESPTRRAQITRLDQRIARCQSAIEAVEIQIETFESSLSHL